ncbi:MAG TPA: ABC transporter permease [Streptosporangiaceae bacterium]|nr:ABC transporter permease [Streptosporangiaceae bacterium]
MSATSGLLPRRLAGPAFRRLAVTELKLFLREKTGVFWGVVFPLVLLIIFGSIPSFHKPAKELGGISYLAAYVPILIALVLALLAISALPTVLASYREKGILRRLATTPVGPARMLGAQLAVQASVTAVTVILLLAVARIAYGVPLPGRPGGFLLAAVLAAAALYSLGLVIGAVVPSSRAAQPIGALVFFPMMFFAGLWLPIAAMPSVLQHISHLTPLGAAVQALGDASARQWPHPLNLAVLAGYAVVLSAAAVKLFRWE